MKIRIQNVRSKLLEETKKKLVVVKNHKTYVGCLFFRKNEDDRLGKVFDEVIIEDDETAIEEMMKLLAKHNMIASDGKTEVTIRHWGWINDLFNEMHYQW